MAVITNPNAFGRVKERHLRRFEGALGCRLPDDYRSFLLATNGGEPVPDRWHVGPTEDRPGFGWTPLGVSVRDFLSLGGPPGQNLTEARSTYGGRVPSDLLVIGTDDAGNAIVLGIGGLVRGSVWFWDHENESAGGEPWWDNLLPLAPTFSTFLDGLMTFEEQQQLAAADLRRVTGDSR